MRHIRHQRPCRHRDVSIHAPTQGATRNTPTSAKQAQVSIHAPTQGATRRQSIRVPERDVSIHAPTQGATQAGGYMNKFFSFQSTHPRRVRRCRASTARPIRVSIHAPTQGATDYDHYLDHLKAVSIHAPTQGATRSRCCTSAETLFQSTHPRRVRRL